LRSIAILLVLIEHYAFVVGRHISAGYYGVDLFFVISGFLITTILVKSDQHFPTAYRKFLGRRTLRIFPIYYLTILILFIIGNEHVHKYLIFCVTYTFNYAIVYYKIPDTSISHFWSLCVEEQFYLFWPFIILGLRNRMTILKWIVLLIVIICSLQLLFNIFPSVTQYNSVGLFPRANSLGIGALGAIFYKEKKIPKNILDNKYLEYLCLIALACLLITGYKIKYLACPLISLLFILKTTHKGFSFPFLNAFLNNNWVVYIGSISYGIYLYHLPLGNYITQYVFDPLIWQKIDFASMGSFAKLQWHSWIIKLPVYSLLSIGLAHVSYKYIEKPILSLKDKWFRY
jgi:peptidoglycan/LPS O-acetylase OafA/YrhL